LQDPSVTAAQSQQTLVDFRSDTVTLPTPEMTDAILDAIRLNKLGDDVMGEDSTVNRLEQRAREIFEMEAAVFVPSGTMGNLIAILTHCRERGSEFIVGGDQHIYVYEQGGVASIGGVHPRVLPNCPDGTLDLQQIAAAVQPDDSHFAVTRCVALENTHNRCGGVALPLQYVDDVVQWGRETGIKVHVDGARIFNAAAVHQVSPARVTQGVDSISVCLSKGLGAPVGSILLGDTQFIQGARRLRKALGGGMRQAGVLAAAGLVAIDSMPDRLQLDHQRAELLAKALRRLDGAQVTPPEGQASNMVVLDLQGTGQDAETFCRKLHRMGVIVNPQSLYGIRFVVHKDVTEQGLQQTIEAITNLAKY